MEENLCRHDFSNKIPMVHISASVFVAQNTAKFWTQVFCIIIIIVVIIIISVVYFKWYQGAAAPTPTSKK